MAHNKTDKKATKKVNNKSAQDSSNGLLDKTKKFWKDMSGEEAKTASDDGMSKAEITRFCIGAVIFVISCFILLSITSHLFTATEDSTWIEGERAKNWMGTLGLATARFFIDECWGVSSFFIPLFFLVTSFRIMRVYKVRLWKWFLNCSILMIWSSAFAHFMFQPILNGFHSPISLGGGIGMTEVDFLQAKTGTVGTFLILIAIALGYLIYLSDETIRIIRKVLAPASYLKSTQKDKTKENTEEQDIDIFDEETAYTGLSSEETATTIEFNDITPEVSDENFHETNNELDIEIVQGQDIIPAMSDDESSENNAEDNAMTIHKGIEEEEAHLDETRQLEPYDPKLDLENYKYPTLDLLKHYDIDTSIDMEEQQQNKNHGNGGDHGNLGHRFGGGHGDGGGAAGDAGCHDIG